MCLTQKGERQQKHEEIWLTDSGKKKNKKKLENKKKKDLYQTLSKLELKNNKENNLYQSN